MFLVEMTLTSRTEMIHLFLKQFQFDCRKAKTDATASGEYLSTSISQLRRTYSKRPSRRLAREKARDQPTPA